MKLKILSCLFVLVLGMGGIAHSRPPSEMKLAYDIEQKILHIDITHVTNNLREHHIRKLEIYKNDLDVEDIVLVTQTTPSTVLRDVPIGAQNGDVLRVKALCSEGGVKEESLTVIEEDKEQK